MNRSESKSITTNEVAQPQGPDNWRRHVPERVRQGWVYIAIGATAVAGAAGSTLGATGLGLTQLSRSNSGGTEAGATYTSRAIAHDRAPIFISPAAPNEGGWDQKTMPPDQNPDVPKPRIDMQPGEDTKS